MGPFLLQRPSPSLAYFYSAIAAWNDSAVDTQAKLRKLCRLGGRQSMPESVLAAAALAIERPGTGGTDFKSKFYDLCGKLSPGASPEQIDAAVKSGAPLLRYGQLISDIITFLIVAFVMFLIAKAAMGYFKKLAAQSAPPPQEALLTEIRDILKEK